jgi:O-antigen ligase
VQAGLVFFTVFVVSRDSPIKRKVKRLILLSSPLAALYLLIGWESGRTIFKPARIARSVIDAQTDSSSFWRELENFDLIATVRLHPIFGTGYGHPYEEIIELPKVYYSLELYAPHNCILGLWAYIGVFGYTALTLLWVAGVYFAMRSYHMATDPSHRVAAMLCFGAVLIYLIQCWGDLGLGSWTGVFLVAPAVATAGKLAKAVGAWGTRTPKVTPAQVRSEPTEQAA